MKHVATWQKSFDMMSEIEYLGEENPGEHYFKISRREMEGFWDVEEDECCYLVENRNVIGMVGYDTLPSQEEEAVMEKILMEKNII